MILTNDDRKWEAFCSFAKRSEEIFVSTYNLYTGITSTGSEIQSTRTLGARRFMSILNEKKAKILVGVPPFHSPKPGCEECHASRGSLVKRYEYHREAYPDISFAFTREHHLKLYIFKSPEGSYKIFAGGINLSCSSFSDILVDVHPEDDKTELVQLFNRLWNERQMDLADIGYWSFD